MKSTILHALANFLRASLVLVITATYFIGCRAPSPETLEAGTFEWAAYTDEQLGYSLEYPKIYAIIKQHDGKDVVFKQDGTTAFRVLFVTQEEGDSRGLWVESKPVENIEMSGRPGRRYVYDHFDGPVYSHTIAFVIDYRDRLLGIEFRTDENMLDEVQKRILDSFKFEMAGEDK